MPMNTKDTLDETIRPTNRVSDLMQINQGFRKSVQIELDFNDPYSTTAYVATDFISKCIERVSSAFKKGSTQRAWRLTGDYGSGKSAPAAAPAAPSPCSTGACSGGSCPMAK